MSAICVPILGVQLPCLVHVKTHPHPAREDSLNGLRYSRNLRGRFQESVIPNAVFVMKQTTSQSFGRWRRDENLSLGHSLTTREDRLERYTVRYRKRKQNEKYLYVQF